MRRLVTARRAALVVVLLGLVAFRVALVRTFQAPAGDGLQYYRVAAELGRSGRFAFGPPPAPLSYTRLPGYPLFLRWVAVPWHPTPLASHLRAATLWNVALDVGTALVLCAMLARTRRKPAAVVALLVFLVWPSTWLQTSFALSESLATFLLALELCLVLRAAETGRLGAAAGAGLCAGLAQLVRFDALALVPAVVLAIGWSAHPRRRRAALLGVFAGVAAVVFAPWPIRNLARFGRPYFAATTWRAMDGTPLGDGMVTWARTWSGSVPGEAYFELFVVNQRPLDLRVPGVLNAKMYDDEREKERVVSLFVRHSLVGLTPGTDAAYRALARERFARRPLHVALVLPVERMLRLFAPEPSYEMAFDVPWLRTKAWRKAFGAFDLIVYALAIGGAVVLARSDRRLLWVLLAALAPRVALYGFAIPHNTTQRYLFEGFPILVALAAVGAAAAAARLRR